MTISAWLASLVPGLVGRVLMALGFGIIAIGGLTVIQGQLADYVTTSWAGMPANILALLQLAGVPHALNIMLGAAIARLSLYMLTSTTRIIGGPVA